MWAIDIVSNSPPTTVPSSIEATIGPPLSMIHLFKLRTPDSISENASRRTRANSMALASLREVKQNLQELIRSISVFERCLADDSEWAEETASSVRFAENITAQEDIDHQ